MKSSRGLKGSDQDRPGPVFACVCGVEALVVSQERKRMTWWQSDKLLMRTAAESFTARVAVQTTWKLYCLVLVGLTAKQGCTVRSLEDCIDK